MSYALPHGVVPTASKGQKCEPVLVSPFGAFVCALHTESTARSGRNGLQ